MQKDIKRLKEEDVLRERRKIKDMGNKMEDIESAQAKNTTKPVAQNTIPQAVKENPAPRPQPAAVSLNKASIGNAAKADIENGFQKNHIANAVKADSWLDDVEPPAASMKIPGPAPMAPKKITPTQPAQKPAPVPPTPAQQPVQIQPQQKLAPIAQQPPKPAAAQPISKPLQTNGAVPQTPPQPTAPMPKPTATGPIKQTTSQQSAPDMSQYANEAQKQQIFLLEGQKRDIEKQIRDIDGIQKPQNASKRNKLTAEKTDWQKKLSALPPVDPQDENSQKNRWSIEKSISELNERIKLLEVEGNHLDKQKIDLQSQISNINTDLSLLYGRIKTQGKAASGPSVIGAKGQVPPKPPTASQSASISDDPLASRPAFSASSKAAVEKLAASAKVEQAARARFMEDVEKWAASTKGTPNQK
jgi:hypothetical protein